MLDEISHGEIFCRGNRNRYLPQGKLLATFGGVAASAKSQGGGNEVLSPRGDEVGVRWLAACVAVCVVAVCECGLSLLIKYVMLLLLFSGLIGHLGGTAPRTSISLWG